MMIVEFMNRMLIRLEFFRVKILIEMPERNRKARHVQVNACICLATRFLRSGLAVANDWEYDQKANTNRTKYPNK